MASILRVNTLTDASSNNSTAMSVINQGVAKAWAKVTYSGGTPSSADSTNISSYNDDGTGDYDANFTNAMSSSDYSASGISVHNTRVITIKTFDSSFAEFQVYDISVNAQYASDSTSSFSIDGDLA